MTRPIHLFLRKKRETASEVIYAALSRDFADDSSLQAVAEIQIHKGSTHYDFSVVGPWSTEKVLPPHFYEIPESEMANRYNQDYPDFKYGAWTARIHAWVTRLIQEGVYPEEAPLPLKSG